MTGERSRGTYTLLIAVPDGRSIQVGALGAIDFDAGWYAYVGSARGPGGFARIDRHRASARGETDPHWHVDYLLGQSAVDLDAVYRSPGADDECALADEMAGTPVTAFGASDCDCPSHLSHAVRRDRLVESCRALHDEVVE